MRKSYTLIEVLVVISILFFLATIVFFNMQGAREREDRMKALTFSSEFKSRNASFLVSEWTFDGPTSENESATDIDVRDLWGDNHGKADTNITVKDKEDCVLGKCLEFNQNKIEIENNFNITDSLTLEAWLYFDDYFNGDILGVPSSYILSYNNNNFIFKVGNKNINFFLPKKEWIHLMLTYDGNNLIIYKNTRLLDKKSVGSITLNSSDLFIIGNINGRIDNVRLYK